jgi:three-Cys-motif partner protein
MTSYNRDGTVGPWAAEKLSCLEKYLAAYTTILRKLTWCSDYIYIDAFAGAGRAKLRTLGTLPESAQVTLLDDPAGESTADGEAEAYIDGSPRVALGLEHPFTKYFFFEMDEVRIDQLRELKSEFSSSRKITIIPGEANSSIQEHILKAGCFDWRNTRAIAFLDPFGLQVPWNTIEGLSKTDAIEVIVNLPVGMAIQRLLPNSGDFSPEKRQRLSEYFGSSDWEAVLYENSSSLFGETRSKRGDSGELLAKWYANRLEAAFGFSAPPRLIRNSAGGHLYYLLWAGPNATGKKIATHVLKQGSHF